MKSRHEMFRHPGSRRSKAMKEHTRARHPTIHEPLWQQLSALLPKK